MTKKVQVVINLGTAFNLSARQVGELLYRLINVGMADAQQVIEDEEGDVAGAEMAASLDITSIVACPVHPEDGDSDQVVPLSATAMNRCLVIVSGGVADYVHDEGVEVELFDWDNYRAESPEGQAEMRVPAHFVDLAQPAGVPVQRSALSSIDHRELKMKHPLIDHDAIEQCAKEAGVVADLCERLLELTLQAHDSQQPHDSLHTREGRNAYKAGIDRLITEHVKQEHAAYSKGGPS